VLREYDARASFFVIDDHVKSAASAARRIRRSAAGAARS
jgi:peptidoglycan/xylan/chitin deacetylase (PgdA/CDA1 family)